MGRFIEKTFETIPGQYIYKVEDFKDIFSVEIEVTTIEKYFFGLIKISEKITLYLYLIDNIRRKVKEKPLHSIPGFYEYRPASNRLLLYYIPDGNYKIIIKGIKNERLD